MGMWSLWRVHDVFEAGTPCEKNMSFDPTVPFNPVNPAVDPTNTFCTGPPGDKPGDPEKKIPWPAIGSRALPDGELARGSWIPAIVPLPTIAMATMPAKVRLAVSPGDDVEIVQPGTNPPTKMTIPMAGRRSIYVEPGPSGNENPGYPFLSLVYSVTPVRAAYAP